MPGFLLAMICLFWTIWHRNDKELLKRRVILSMLIVLYISYIGLARRLFSVLYCVPGPSDWLLEDSTDQFHWSQDTSVVCFEGSHAILLLIFALPLIFAVLLSFPIASAIFLFAARGNQALSSPVVKETLGFMYQAYKEDYVFWDCAILLRKAALALIVTFGLSLNGNIQGLLAVCIVGIALYLQLTFMPFNDDFYTLNMKEKYSLTISFVTFLAGVFLSDASVPSAARIVISVFVLVANLSFVLYSLHDIYIMVLRVVRLSLQHHNISVERKSHFKLLSAWAQQQFSELTLLLNSSNNT